MHNKALHKTAIPLRSIDAGELWRWADRASPSPITGAPWTLVGLRVPSDCLRASVAGPYCLCSSMRDKQEYVDMTDESYDGELKQLALDAAETLRRLGAKRSYNEPIFDFDVMALFLREYAQDGDIDRLLDTCLTIDGLSVRAIVTSFFKRFLANVRDIVCSKKGRALAKGADLSAKGLSTALAVWITSAVGAAEPTAVALSTVIILVIGSAAKNSFCEMTDVEILQELKKPTAKGAAQSARPFKHP